MFKSSKLYYYDDEDEASTYKPIVTGGLFSMDPSDCLAEGFVSVDNYDDETMDDYSYAVVEASQASSYNYLSSLLSKKVFAFMFYKLSVSEAGVIQVSAMGHSAALLVSDLYVSDNEYFFPSMGVKFVVEDEDVTHAYLMMGDVIAEEFDDITSMHALEADLAALMGDDVYSNGELQIFASEGMLMFMETDSEVPMPLSVMGNLTTLDGNYIYHLGEIDLVFVVEDDELANIAMMAGDEQIVVLVKQIVTLLGQITIGENTVDYYDLAEFVQAFHDIEAPAYVTLLDDVIMPDGSIINNTHSGADITLNLNGHNITGNISDIDILRIERSKLTIVGEGVVQNLGANGNAIGSMSSVVINQGTYIADAEICFVGNYCELIINGGNFKAPALYYDNNGFIRPIVTGGLFSMDPSDCVAEGYEAVANDDEDTKAEYPYKVVEKSLIPTAIPSLNADKSGKTLKTIENGRVIIIRGGDKFDLSGHKL